MGRRRTSFTELRDRNEDWSVDPNSNGSCHTPSDRVQRKKKDKRDAASGPLRHFVDQYLSPFPYSMLCRYSKLWKICGYFLGYLLFLLYVVIPLIIFFNPWIMKEVVFMRIIHYPFMMDFDNIEYFQLDGAINFMVNESDAHLGTWHIPPKSLAADFSNDNSLSAHQESLGNGKPVILYFHGNTGTRGGMYRLRLYRQLAAQDFHVVTFDYSGFGESPGYPSEERMVEDGKVMYRWVKKHAKSSSVYVYGHSLGCGVSSRMMRELSESLIKDDLPKGLILEAPFNNVREAAAGYPVSQLWKFYPYFEKLFIDPISDSGIHFRNDEHIAHILTPVLIMHAVDDLVIPFELGKKLYEAAVHKRPATMPFVVFRKFDEKDCRCGHYMFRSPNTMKVVRNFMERVQDKKKNDMQQV